MSNNFGEIEMPQWVQMGNDQPPDFSPMMDVLKMQVQKARQPKTQGGAGGGIAGALGANDAVGKAGGMKPESL